MLSASFFIPLPRPYLCDKTIVLEISARDRSCFLWSVNFLVFLLAAWSKVFRKALLNFMKEQVSRLASIQLPSSSVTVFRLIFATRVKH